MHRHRARIRHVALRSGGGGSGCAAALTGGMDQHPERGSAAASRDLPGTRGARRDRHVLDRGRRCRGDRGGRGGRGGIPGVGGRETPQAAKPSSPNKRPPTTVARHATAAACDGTATASKGPAQQCGSASSSSRDGGSPSKTDLARRPGPQTRRRARQLPSFLHRKKFRGAMSAASAHGVSRRLPLTGLLNTRS